MALDFKTYLFFIISAIIMSFNVNGQAVISPEKLNNSLYSLSHYQTGLNNKVQLNNSDLDVVYLLHTIGREKNVYLRVDLKMIELLTYNFHEVPMKDVFAFLYRNHDIEITLIFSTISFKDRPK